MNPVRISFLVFFVTLWPLSAAAEELYVQVRETKLRASADFLGRSVQSLRYGEKLKSEDDSESWIKVTTSRGVAGYVHRSAVTERPVVLRANAKTTAENADGSDVVLAGKGFNAEVEQQYAQSSGVNFTAVNSMERRGVSDQELSSFVKAGGLKSQGG